VLESALYLSIECIQPIQRQGLAGGETLPGARVGAVVEHHAVLERKSPLRIERLWGVRDDQAQPQLDVTQQLTLAAALDPRRR